VLGAACAAVAPETKDPAYVRARSSYEAGRWSEAQDSLEAFLDNECRNGPATGCERAVWMKVQADLQVNRPALAAADADRARVLGPPREHLEPPLAALRARALTQIEAQDQAGERTAHLEASFRDEVNASCQIVAFTFSLDLDPAQVVPLDRLDGRARLFDPAVTPGDHLLAVSARFECKLKDGTLEMLGRGSHAFLVGTEQPVKVLVRSYLRTDMLPLASLPEKLAFDFQPLSPQAR
jgi:hypothetical protein